MKFSPDIDLRESRRIHLVGIGGAGMGPIAQILNAEGHVVTGTDASVSPMTQRLEELGIAVTIGDGADLAGVDLLGCSTAVSEDHPLVLEADRRGILVVGRFGLLRCLGALKSTLSVSGTHGKTTTSALVAHILDAAGRNPSFLVGALVHGLGTTCAWTGSSEFVLEADESDATFLAPPRAGAIVTNIDADHLDFYGSFEALLNAFDEFVDGTDGPVVVCGDDEFSRRYSGRNNVITYGRSTDNDVVISELVSQGSTSTWNVTGAGLESQFTLGVPGVHLVLNATAAAILCRSLGVTDDDIAMGLSRYRSASRRFESRGNFDGISLIDDYAHMPVEVETVLDAARQITSGRVIAVFQPHRYSRTKHVWQDFDTSFVDADVVVVTEIYAAGETPIDGLSGSMIADRVRRNHDGEVVFVESLDQAAEWLNAHLRSGDTCVTLGAGDITRLPDLVLASQGGAR